jgi:hypothetical protein
MAGMPSTLSHDTACHIAGREPLGSKRTCRSSRVRMARADWRERAAAEVPPRPKRFHGTMHLDPLHLLAALPAN